MNLKTEPEMEKRFQKIIPINFCFDNARNF